MLREMIDLSYIRMEAEHLDLKYRTEQYEAILAHKAKTLYLLKHILMLATHIQKRLSFDYL